MKRKKSLLVLIVVLAAMFLIYAGYNIYRYPALFRSMPDGSLNEAQVDKVRENILSMPDIKILVACFSYSGTTRNVANVLSEKTGADLFEITPGDEYTSVYTQSNSEIRGNKRPVLAGTIENMDEYDIVFVGFPVWWHATPAPVNTFLESYDLTGKLIIPFCTSDRSGIDEAMPSFLNSCEGLAVYGEMRISGTGQIDGWLNELGLADEAGQEQSGKETGDSMEEQVKPEAGKREGITVLTAEELPTYEYEQREIEVFDHGERIYGVAYIPDTGEDRVPLVICAHGLGGSYRSNIAYAEQLASHGIAAYCFDFRGGGGSMSDGDATQMSVMTEVADLEVIMEAAREWDFTNTDQIVLLGASQGGITSAIAAARHPEEIAGLILIYPAFMISDAIHEQFNSLDDVPESFWFNWIIAGRPYVEDMWDYDVYDEIGNYKDKVLLLHGSDDEIVPVSYSERATEIYDDVEYYVIDGVGHGFNGGAFDEAVEHIFNYLQEIQMIRT